MTDDAFVPSHTGAHQQPIAVGQILENLAVAQFEAERGQPRRLFQQCIGADIGQRPAADLGQQRLLTQALLQFGAILFGRCVVVLQRQGSASRVRPAG